MTDKESGGDWVQQKTADVSSDQDVEWVESVNAGTILEGELVTAFLMPDENASKGFRAAYRYRDPSGHLWNFGERFSFRDAIRDLREGSKFRLEFLSEKKIGKGRTQWLVDFRAIPSKKGEKMVDLLMADYKRRDAAIPF
jgi:hypothetical protein